jgi:uncharacterized membrane protein
MAYETRSVTVRGAAPPIHRVLQSFPVAGFAGALVTDIVYAWTTDMIWSDFSDWLLAVGFIFGVLAAIAGLISLVAHRRQYAGRTSAVYIIGSLIVMVLAGFNNLVHSRDAWTSVVPTGLALSAATVVVMLLTFWLGGQQAARESMVVNQVGAGI